MIRDVDLDRALADYFVAETTDGAPSDLLERVLAGTHDRRPRRDWELLLRHGRVRATTTAPSRLARSRGLLVAGLTVAVAVVGFGLWVGRPSSGPATSPTPTPSPAATPSSSPAAATLGFGLDGTWTADKPSTLRFSEPSGSIMMALVLGRRTTVASGLGPVDWFTSDTNAAEGSLTFVALGGGSGPGVAVGGPSGGSAHGSPEPVDLAPCEAGASGEYAWFLGDGGDTLNLHRTFDPCEARSAVLADRVWTRVTPVGGDGANVTADFDPAFSVALPVGHAYVTSRTNASWEVRALDGAASIQAWRDPQVMRDPCDARAGRIDLDPGPAAFLAVLRGRPTLEVSTPVERTVGGHVASSVMVTDLGSGCANGLANAWQPKDESSGRVWSTNVGHPLHLTLVDVEGITVLLAVDADNAATERAILDSIEFAP